MKKPDMDHARILFDEIIYNNQTEKFEEFCQTFGEYLRNDKYSFTLISQILDDLLKVSRPQEKANLMLQTLLETLDYKLKEGTEYSFWQKGPLGGMLIEKALSIGNQQAAIMLQSKGKICK